MNPPNLREGSSRESKMCVSLQRRAIQNFKMYVLLQRRAPKCINPAHDVREDPRHRKISILPQFRTSDQHEVTRGLRGHFKICVSPQFWTSDEHETTRGLPDDPGRFAFHLSFGRPMSRKRREGCDDDVENSHFTSFLDVR